MDVRCEKCSTEYELDEARLKPGGVTVKCTNCGHTFKVRRRSPSAVEVVPTMPGMPRGPAPATPAPPVQSPAASAAAGAAERQWLIRLENGETRSCRELATLQQWILAGEVTRDALISRSGKTWKLLGDILELGTYFTIADEAKQQRSRRESVKTAAGAKKAEEPRTTLVGVGAVSSGAMALGDLDNEDIGDNDPTTARRAAPRNPARPSSSTDEVVVRTTTPHAAGAEPVPARGKNAHPTSSPPPVSGLASTMPVAPASPPMQAAPAGFSAPAAPVAPVPQAVAPSVVPPPAGWPVPVPSSMAGMSGAGQMGQMGTTGQGATGPTGAPGPMGGIPVAQSSMPWTGAAPGMAPGAPGPGGPAGFTGSAAGPAGPPGPVDGPMLGRLRQTGDEPAFAGGRPGPARQVSQPFTGMARDSMPRTGDLPGGTFAPDEDLRPAVAPRGSRAGLWIAIASLAVIAGGFAVVYLLVLKTPEKQPVVNPPAADAGVTEPPVTAPPPDAAAVVPVPDAATAVTAPADAGAAELATNVEARMRAAVAALADSSTKDEAATLAMRARLLTAIAQSLEDRAALLPAAERSAAEKLRSKSKEAVNEALPLVARALKAAPNEISANLAMADLMRLQGKSAKDMRRYLDAVRAAAPSSPELAILDGLMLLKEGKLAGALQLWTRADAGEARLEQSGDVRLRFRIAVASLADGKAVEARAAVDTVLAAQPEHEGAKALLARLEQAVASTDPLPPEEPGGNDGSGGSSGVSSSDSYEKLVKRADELAEKSCTRAIPVYQTALEKKPDGVTALIGMGFCHIEIKNFSSANSRFRTVLALQPKNERALWGIGQLYQEQGDKKKAIDAFRTYLEAYPNSPAAKRQLEQLGAGASDEPGSGSGSGSGADPAAGSGHTPAPPPETPPAAPPAAPAPAPGESAQ